MPTLVGAVLIPAENQPAEDSEDWRGPFGKTLKRYRERSGRYLSQSKLAERAGFDHSYVSRLESGQRTPTRDAVDRLAHGLELNDDEHDDLLKSAGFLPNNLASLFSEEAELAEVYALLHNNRLREAYRDSMRQVLALLADQARLVMQEADQGADEEPKPRFAA